MSNLRLLGFVVVILLTACNAQSQQTPIAAETAEDAPATDTNVPTQEPTSSPTDVPPTETATLQPAEPITVEDMTNLVELYTFDSGPRPNRILDVTWLDDDTLVVLTANATINDLGDNNIEFILDNAVVHQWNVADDTWEDLFTIPDHIRFAQWSPDVQYLAIQPGIYGRFEEEIAPIQIWEKATGEVIQEIPLAAEGWEPDGFIWSATSTWLANRANYNTRVWDVETGTELMAYQATKLNCRTVTSGTTSLIASASSPDGRMLATADETDIIVFDLATGEQITTLTATSGSDHCNRVDSLYWTQDGKYMMSIADDYSKIVWDMTTYSVVVEIPADRNLGRLIAIGGTTYLTGRVDEKIALFDINTLEEVVITQLTQLPQNFSPNGAYLAMFDIDGVIQIWGAAP